jgi:hypothetical protein
MNRRDAIQRVALLMGGVVSASAILGVLKGYAKEPGPDWKPLVLGKEDLAVVERVVDIILPRTDTPGALDVGVPAFVDTMLKEVYSKEARDHYLKGLRDFDAAAQQAHHTPFVKLEREQQKALVQRFQDAAIADERAVASQKQQDLVQKVRAAALLVQRTKPSTVAYKRSFILATKEVALLGFFTSQPGATQVLQYVATPGAYHGCLPVSQAGNGKSWATY